MSNLSVIIVNYKSWTPLKICLDSLLNQKKIKPKIIVLDNNSDDNKFIDFKSKYKSINWIKNQENYGFSKACNIGSNIAKTEWILFLNPDSLIPKDCLEKLMNKVSDEKNKIIGIKQLNEKDQDTHAYGIFLSYYSINGIFRFIYRILNNQTNNILSKKKNFSPDWISGSFILIKKKDLDKIGGWDEDFFMYYEDMDICKRAIRFNIKTQFYNDLHCYHFHGKSSRADYKTKVNSKTQVIKSSHIFIKKHYSALNAKLISLLLFSSQIIELIVLSPFIKEKRGILNKLIKN